MPDLDGFFYQMRGPALERPEPQIVAQPSPHPLDKLYADPAWLREFHEEMEAERAKYGLQPK